MNFVSYFFLVVIVVTLTDCATGKKNDVMLLNNYYYKMIPGETIDKNSQSVVDKYEKYFNNDDTMQVPLYKYIKSDKYELFIGIPLDATIEKLKRTDPVADSTFFDVVDENSIYRQYEKDNLFMTQYFVTPDNKNFTAVFVMADSKATIDSLFTESTLAARIYK